jgi:hypothetical protein
VLDTTAKPDGSTSKVVVAASLTAERGIGQSYTAQRV